MPKTIVVDQNAHDILMKAKNFCRKNGIEKPTHSDAIRFLGYYHKQSKKVS